MSMREPSNIYVCNVMGDMLYPLDDIDKDSVSMHERLNGQSELSFTYTKSKEVDATAYDVLEEGMYLYVEDIGHFKTRQPSIRIDAATESKAITAYSCDVEFEDKTVTFPVNMGTETSLEFLLNDGKQELPYIWTDVDNQKHAGFELLRDPYTMIPYDWIVLYNRYVDQLSELRTWFQEWSVGQTADIDGKTTIACGYRGYYDSVEDKFYEDEEKTVECPKVDGMFYADIENNHVYTYGHDTADTENPYSKTFLWAEIYDAYDVVDDASFKKCMAVLDQMPRLVSRTEHDGSVEGYFDATIDKFYADSSKTLEIEKVDGRFYIDMTIVDGEPALTMYRWEHDRTSSNPHDGSFVFAESYSNADVVTVEKILDVSTVDYSYHQYVFKTENDVHEVTALSYGADFEQRICMLIGYYTKYGKQLSLLDILCAQMNEAWVPGNVYGLQNNPVDYTLANQKMQFDINETIYSFLVTTFAQWSKCLVTFDILNRRINITPVEYVGNDTGVVFTYDQLLNTLNISSTEDTLATRLTILGGDNLSIEQVNFGEDQVVDIAYKLNARDRHGRRIYVSDELAEKYARYEKVRERLRTGKAGLEEYAATLDPESEEYADVRAELDAWIENTDGYFDLSKKRNKLNAELYELKYRVPADSVHDNWDTYNEEELNGMLKTYSNKLHALEQLYAEDYGLAHQSALDPWVEITAGSTYPIPDWLPERNDYPYMMPRISFIQNTMYWWDYIAYQQTITQIGIAMLARFDSDPAYRYSGISAESDDANVREQYKRITAYETEWSLYGSVELEAKIGSYDVQLQTMIDGNAVEVKHYTWDNLATMQYQALVDGLAPASGSNPKINRWIVKDIDVQRRKLSILTSAQSNLMVDGYYDVSVDRFYADSAKTTELTKVAGRFYRDITLDDGAPVNHIYRYDGTYGNYARVKDREYQARFDALAQEIDAQLVIIRQLSTASQSQIYVLSEDTNVDNTTYTVTIDGVTSSFTITYCTSLQSCFTDTTGTNFDAACDVLKKKKVWDSLESEEHAYFTNADAYAALINSNVTTKEAILWNDLTDAQRQKYGNVEANYLYDAYKEIFDKQVDAQTYLDTVIMPSVYAKEDEVNEVQRKRNLLANNARLTTYKNPTIGEYYGESFNNYELKVLNLLMRDAEYTNEYIFTTAVQDTVEAVDKMEELYADAVEQVRTFSRPQLTFTADIDNLMALPEFQDWNSSFDLGNYIYVEYRDGEYARVRMVGRTYNPCIVGGNQLSIEFSNITYTKTKVSDVESVLGMASATTSSGGSSGGGGGGSNAAWDEVYAVLSNAMIKRLLSPETFVQEVTRVVADKVVKKSLTTKEQIYNSLVEGLANISGSCLSAGVIRSEAENAYGQPISWFNLDDGTFNYGDGALMFNFDGRDSDGNPIAWLTLSGEVDATSGNIGGVQIGSPYDENFDAYDYLGHLLIGKYGFYYQDMDLDMNAFIPYTSIFSVGVDSSTGYGEIRLYAYDYSEQSKYLVQRREIEVDGDGIHLGCYTFSDDQQGAETSRQSIELDVRNGTVSATGNISGGSLQSTGAISGASVAAGSGGITNSGGYTGSGILRLNTTDLQVMPQSNTAAWSSSDITAFTTAADGVIIRSTGRVEARRQVRTNDVRTAKINGTSADYAEYFEWSSAPAQDADLRGRFVTLDGDKIRLATPNDGYLLGIVSSAPLVLANAAWDSWHNKYLRDEFGAIVTEPVEYPAVLDDDGNVIEEARIEYEPVINPDYDPTREYIPREQRPEWAPVGLVGQIIMLDDGTCEVNGFATSADEGIATKADGVTNYRVIKRIDSNHIMVAAK